MIPQIVDELANTDPTRIYASFPRSTNVSDGFRDVTFRELAQAADAASWWLERKIGRSDSSETLAYMGLSDIRYTVVFLAAVKCGFKIFFPSPRNPASTNVSLLEQTGCKGIWYSAEMTPKVDELQSHMKKLNCFPIPSLEDVLGAMSDHYPYEEIFEQVIWKPILVLHSSGSTGTPKAVTMNHGTFSALDNDRYIPEVPGRRLQTFCCWDFVDGGKFYSPFPAFHLAGVATFIVIPIMSAKASLVTGPPSATPNGSLVNEIMMRQKLKAMYVPPSIVEQIMDEPEGFDRLKELEFLIYSGGPLSAPVGDRLCQELDLCGYYGATEFFQIHTFVPRPEDWSYMEWIPIVKADMQPSVDGAYELVLHNDFGVAKHRPLYYNFPKFRDWHTKDLFKPHPSKPNLWRYHGRSDDILVFSNGGKFSPIAAEALIQTHPSVAGAIIVGTARFQAALMIEPKSGLDSAERAHLVEQIWPTVEKANLQNSAQGRILRSMILVALPERPFARAGKGTIVRHLVTTAYASEIDQLYAAVEASERPGLTNVSFQDLRAIRDAVHRSVLSILGKVEVSNQDDFFSRGLDSVKTVELVTLLRSAFSTGENFSNASLLSPRIIYKNPTIEMLSSAIMEAANSSPEANGTGSYAARRKEIELMIERYTNNLPAKEPKKFIHPSKDRINVALTGSTGSLGSYLLRSLSDDPRIGAIYCLDRSTDARQTHEKSFTAHGFSLKGLSKISFLHVDFSLNQLGMPTKQYAELSHQVDVIMHNAWEVNFNMALDFFGPTHIHGLRSLIDWSIGSDRKPRIVFLSSVSSIANWHVTHKDPAPERLVEDISAVPEMGYAQSKYVSERILSIAGKRCGVPVSILRIGQIAGPITSYGTWPNSEWFPLLIKSSLSVGVLPNSLPPIDWIPIDTLSTIMIDVVHHSQRDDNPRFYNIVNPRRTSWSSLVATVKNRHGSAIREASMVDWIEVIKQVGPDSELEVATKPALKILDFFESLAGFQPKSVEVVYETRNAVAASKAMAELEPVSQKWIEVWLDQLQE